MKQFILFILVSAVLLLAGCSSDLAGDRATQVSVVLSTRSATASTAAHRLLVFPASGDADPAACLLNYSFTSGRAVTLPAGSYRFVTLTESACLDLPAAGTTDGLSFNNLLSLKTGVVLQLVQASRPTEVTLPGTASYTASLTPVTCLLKLQLTDAPEGLILQLVNMYNGIPLAGTYAGNESVIAYTLSDNAENICLPTKGNAMLQYQYRMPSGEFSSSATLDLGMPFEPGYTYSAQLQWMDTELKITSSVEKWKDGNETTGDAE